MSTFEIYKFLHVVAAIIWVGSGILGAVFTHRARSAAPADRLDFARDMNFAAQRVFGPFSVLTLVFGILMVVEADAFGFSQMWVAMGIGAVALSSIIGVALLGPHNLKLIAELEQGSQEAATARLVTISRIELFDVLVLLTAVWVMVAKPGLGG
jgi:uncharacterized membrane protein